MKNLIYLMITACCLFASNLDAQTPMTKGTNVVLAGVGLGGYGYSYSSSVSPTIAGSFQRGIVDNLGPGNLSVGGTIAFKSGSYDGYWTDYKWNYFALSGRASYHPHFVKSEKFDFYGGLGLGYYNVSSNFEGVTDYLGTTSVSTVAFTAHLGGRYMFTDKVGAWLELGNHLSILSGGVAIKF